MGTETPGGAQRHGRVDAEFAGFVARGRNDTALIRPAPHNDGLATQIGAGEEFNRDEKGIHVHVQNRGMERNLLRRSAVVLGAKASELRHGDKPTTSEGVKQYSH